MSLTGDDDDPSLHAHWQYIWQSGSHCLVSYACCWLQRFVEYAQLQSSDESEEEQELHPILPYSITSSAHTPVQQYRSGGSVVEEVVVS